MHPRKGGSFFLFSRCLQRRPNLAADWRPGRRTESAPNKKGKRKGARAKKSKQERKMVSRDCAGTERRARNEETKIGGGRGKG